MAQLRNPHYGEILKEVFLAETGPNRTGPSQNKLAEALGVPGNRIHTIVGSLEVGGTRDINADTDLRLCRFVGLSECYVLRLQNAFDTMEAKRRIGAEVARIRPYMKEQAA